MDQESLKLLAEVNRAVIQFGDFMPRGQENMGSVTMNC